MGQNDGPLISVLMGVLYHRESIDLLERSVCSIQSQTYCNWELLICDDGSTRAACQYLDEAAIQDDRIHLLRGCPRTDLASKLNWCLKAAKGMYIARMDDDDFSYPDRFEKQIAALDANPAIAFVGCNVHLYREGAICGMRVLAHFPQVKDFYMTQPFIHPSLMFRKVAVVAVDGYSEAKHQFLCEDYDLLLRMYTKGYYGMNLQEFLLDYTIHSTTHRNRKMIHRWNEVVTRWQRFRELRKLPETLPFVIKPFLIGMIPKCLLNIIQAKRYNP